MGQTNTSWLFILVVCILLGCGKDDDLNLCCPSEPVTLSFSENIISFPNAYTPNGNGINDTYRPFLQINNPDAISSFSLSILRDGQSIYSERNDLFEFGFSESATELLELQYEVVSDSETFIGKVEIISLAGECFTLEDDYFLLDQFDETLLAYREVSAEIGCN